MFTHKTQSHTSYSEFVPLYKSNRVFWFFRGFYLFIYDLQFQSMPLPQLVKTTLKSSSAPKVLYQIFCLTLACVMQLCMGGVERFNINQTFHFYVELCTKRRQMKAYCLRAVGCQKENKRRFKLKKRRSFTLVHFFYTHTRTVHSHFFYCPVFSSETFSCV